MSPPDAVVAEGRAQLRRLRVAALVEGGTLLALVLVAVPLKHLLGHPEAVSVMGPFHGAAFLFDLWTLAATASGGGWRAGEVAALALAALVPFGALASHRLLRRREAALAGAG